MKLRLLALGLMMSLMISLMDAAAPPSDEKSVDEAIEEANKGMGLFEGDVRLEGGRNAVVGARMWPKRRSRVIVRYRLSSSYSRTDKGKIISALKEIEARTCVKFYPISRFWGWFIRHLYIHSGSGCWSYIGVWRSWRRSQPLSLNKDGCLSKATIQHEILHALAFAHEHSRSDRDKYVKVLYHNIQSGKSHNFRKYRTNNLRTPYDFNSVMQYSNYAFSKNREMTLQSRRNPSQRFGYATSMSYNDYKRINTLYRCYGY